jgi:small subunit ribosomal protein S25e
MKEAPTWRLISQSILIERLKVNGSLARVAIRHLEKEGLIKRIVHHSGQLIYSAFFSMFYIMNEVDQPSI